jgi:hypothetical protein
MFNALKRQAIDAEILKAAKTFLRMKHLDVEKI